MTPKQKVCRRRCALLAVLLLAGAALYAAPPEILVILSYDPASPTTPDIQASLDDAFPGDKYNVYLHCMNTKRIPGPERTELFRREIAQEISSSGKPDLVLACDDNALRFSVNYRETLFPGVSIVFAGVNDDQYAKNLVGTPGITGVLESVSLGETIGLMRIMFPGMLSLDIVNDTTETGAALYREIRELGLPLPVRLISFSNQSEDSFVRELRDHDPKRPLLLLVAYSGHAGKTYSFWQSLALIKNSTKSPVVGLWKHGIGNGLLGGVVESHYEQIRIASVLAKRVLAGEKAESIPFVANSPNKPIFDWNELRREGISPAKLPIGTQLINRPLGLFETHPTFFWLLIVSFTAIAGLLAALLIIVRYRGKAAVQLARNVAFLNKLINSIDSPIYLKDTEGRYTMVNHSFATLSQRNPADLLGKKSGDLLSEETSAKLTELDRKVMQDGQTHQAEINSGPGTARRIFTVTKTPIEDMNRNTLILGSMQDVTADRRLTEQLKTENTRLDALVAERTAQLEKLNDELTRMAETDQLTKLANRRKLDAILYDEIGMAKRYGQPVSLIMFDLDHFKLINDELGHQTGDEVLAAVADIIARNCRETDLAGRWGGEEFLIVCRGSAESGAAELAEKLREKFEQSKILQDRSLTASFGVCEWRPGDTMDAMIPKVDERLYAAKRAGRNCVVDANGAHRGGGKYNSADANTSGSGPLR
jgi:diguanylate cyclase (GGDEF)-like protein/PAS domain S-box-containing protein